MSAIYMNKDILFEMANIVYNLFATNYFNPSFRKAYVIDMDSFRIKSQIYAYMYIIFMVDSIYFYAMHAKSQNSSKLRLNCCE